MFSDDFLVLRARLAGRLLLMPKDWRSGMHAKYRRLTREWGCKFFSCESHRDLTFEIHERLATYKLSPRVKCLFEFQANSYYPTHSKWVHKTRTFYGYLIEHADTTKRPSASEFRQLLNDIEEYGSAYYWCDIAGDNIGWLNGRYIAVDVSCCERRDENAFDNGLLNESDADIHGFRNFDMLLKPKVYYV